MKQTPKDCTFKA